MADRYGRNLHLQRDGRRDDALVLRGPAATSGSTRRPAAPVRRHGPPAASSRVASAARPSVTITFRVRGAAPRRLPLVEPSEVDRRIGYGERYGTHRPHPEVGYDAPPQCGRAS